MLTELDTDPCPLLARNIGDQAWTMTWSQDHLQPHQFTSMSAGEGSKDTASDLFGRPDRQRHPAMPRQAHRRCNRRINRATPGSRTQPN
ncbi:hypothetical protein AWC04_01795 [Mycolicibacterium fallax]|uniref:Uncharacterized protein n=1 Tax=Mycolicibacterium fallax TaxID=1793 RepID=A0A1X1RLM4_MYCFA|nr:hypothetical protein AWC04_01795 [Mycolicibacterium fallax]BBY97311.1 hypothetical protein MFAL_07780 [Mycolicibacterium fallax]